MCLQNSQSNSLSGKLTFERVHGQCTLQQYSHKRPQSCPNPQVGKGKSAWPMHRDENMPNLARSAEVFALQTLQSRIEAYRGNANFRASAYRWPGLWLLIWSASILNLTCVVREFYTCSSEIAIVKQPYAFISAVKFSSCRRISFCCSGRCI
jgi:hypothetical protein